MKEPIKELAAFSFLIAVALFCLGVFSLIAINGGMILYEPSPAIIGLELALCVGLLCLGIERLNHFRKRFK